MRKMSFSFGFAALVLLTMWTIGSACGDKFLVVGRGIRYERARAAVHPGSILIYRNKNYDDPKEGTELEKALVKVGHKVQTVNDVTQLDGVLKAGKFDLVIMNLADAPLLEKQVIDSPSKPAVLPIIYNRTGKEVTAAGKQYDCVLKAASRNSNVLSVVDEAMGDKQKNAPVKCKWSK